MSEYFWLYVGYFFIGFTVSIAFYEPERKTFMHAILGHSVALDNFCKFILIMIFWPIPLFLEVFLFIFEPES